MQVRKLMLQCIMATDMDRHGDIMETFKRRMSGMNGEPELDPQNNPHDAAFFSQVGTYLTKASPSWVLCASVIVCIWVPGCNSLEKKPKQALHAVGTTDGG